LATDGLITAQACGSTLKCNGSPEAEDGNLRVADHQGAGW
jgi:hypothetical protein